MTFADVPCGASLFVDANTFVYHFSPHSVFGPACTDLLDRITRRDIAGSTSLDVVSQQHGLLSGDAMLAAIMQHFGIVELASHDSDFDRITWLTRYSPV